MAEVRGGGDDAARECRVERGNVLVRGREDRLRAIPARVSSKQIEASEEALLREVRMLSAQVRSIEDALEQRR